MTDGLRGIKELNGLDASGLRIGIVASTWNAIIVDTLLDACKKRLEELGAEVIVERVSGAYELPCVVQAMLVPDRCSPLDAVVAIGCLIKGETMHFEYICEAVTQGLMRLNMDHKTPVIYGVLNVLSEDQAKGRAGLLANTSNGGTEWANAAVQSCMVLSKYYDQRAK
eukprot:GEMP01110723.1.p1 GENE.GEMP01110723.1~~GEMP01110723.1.p1  ORF type:complete len:168 (+),score=49.59 GEMP01110723.1:33-536(+)